MKYEMEGSYYEDDADDYENTEHKEKRNSRDYDSKLLIEEHERPFYMNLIHQINAAIKKKYRIRNVAKARRKQKVLDVVNDMYLKERYNEHIEFVAPMEQFFKKEKIEPEPVPFDDLDDHDNGEDVYEVEMKPRINHIEVDKYADPGAKLPECVHCEEVFRTLAAYKNHMKEHHAPKLPHLCEVCQKQFRTKTLLKQHQRYHGDKKHICDDCGEGFAFATTLRRHQLIHTKEKPFSCTLCSKSFPQKNHLTRHLALHSGIAEFECITCEKKYKRKEGLLRHCRTNNHVS